MVEITPYQRRLVAVIPGRRPEGTVAATNSGDKYYIYSSKTGKSSGGNVHVLSPSPKNVDNFLFLLPDQGIILSAEPSGISASLDATDRWDTWMTNWDPSGQVSVTYDNAKDLNIQSFEFRLKVPWDVTFSSSADAIKFAFGTRTLDSSSLVPSPGMTDDGTPLYLGLDPEATPNNLKSTVGNLYTFAGLDTLGKSLPIKGLAGLGVTLKLDNAGEKRNALWFSPDLQLKTTMRLQFDIDGAEVLEEALRAFLPGLDFQGVSIACKKTMVLVGTNKGAQPVATGEIEIEIDCSVQPPSGDPVKMLLALQISKNNYELTFKIKPESKDGLTGIIGWLIGLLPQGSGVDSVENVLASDNLFKDHIFLRRLKVAVDASGSSPKIAGVSLDIEVSGTFGQGSDQSQRVAFLVSYNWSAGMGTLGTISGSFWNWFNSDDARVLNPNYRAASDLLPVTNTPATALDVVTLIPGQKVDTLPANVPTQVTKASIYLSQSQFAIQATLQSKDSTTGEKESTVPQIDLGRIDLSASYSWGSQKDFKLSLGITSVLIPSKTSKHPESAILTGSLDYSSGDKTWELKASLQSLYASTLCEFFDPDSVDHVIPLIDSLVIDHLTLDYKYTGSSEVQGKAVGTYFKFDGLILVGGLALQLDFHYENQKPWSFTATLQPQDKEATIGSVLSDILGDDDLDLPTFLADTKISAKDSPGGIKLDVEKSPGAEGVFQFMSSIQVGELELTFAQIHLAEWDAKIPSKRFVKFALVGLPEVDLPLIGDLTQPFDEMYLMWVQDGTGLNKASPGLTRQEIDDLNKTLTDHPLVPKDKFQSPAPKDVLISAGSHFAIITKDQQGVRTCVLDYDFKKSQPQQQPKPPKQAKALTLAGEEEEEEQDDDDLEAEGPPKPDSDGNSSSAPFKKKSGPLAISNIGLKYADKTLHIQFTATFELGPLGFSLIGFSINLQITSLHLDGITMLLPSLEGLSASFEKPPLTIAGIIRHGKSENLDYYAGGLIIGWVPYQLQAAGFYGDALPEGSTDPNKRFKSVFVFARLDGPLVTLEFAEISGVTGGFGYKSEVRVPTADQVVNFPFVKSTSLAGATESALTTLERLTSPKADGWFKPLDDTYWAAAGMKIDAFQMISLDAVAVIQFGQSIKMGLFAVALADIPTSASKVKFAHVELGIAVVIDLDYGTLKAEAQLSPNSYILDPNCHLTGGSALYYWFDAPHADRSLIGDFVFTLGGYHQAFAVPAGYPNPPRLAISWSLGSNLSITGQAYFAITPKACMGGGRLHAAFHAGPIEAWFDAFADFLINYKPFHFLAEAGISVGVRFNLDVLFIHIHISVEVGADLTLWGPPMAGRVHVDIKVAKFDINFGSAGDDKPPASLLEFYHLVLQASSKQTKTTAAAATAPKALAEFERSRVIELDDDDQPLLPQAAEAEEEGEDDPPKKDEGHTFLAQSGLMNDTDKPERDHNQTWTVRGGTFSFVVGCKIAIAKAEQVDEKDKPIATVEYTDETIYAKPMHLTDALDSSVKISITQEDSHEPPKVWPMEKFVKSVPTGLWAKYNDRSDPSKSGNNISELLDTSDGGIRLMMGVLLTGPPPFMSEDKLPTFIILDANLEDLDAVRKFPVPVPASEEWVGAQPQEGKAQWDEVHRMWETPNWDSDAAAALGGKDEEEEGEREEEKDGVQTTFVATWAVAFGWDAALAKMAKMPLLLEKRFDQLYVAAPLLTK